jgi:ferric-dicitrate binding protein FerR (iron transport regulator)
MSDLDPRESEIESLLRATGRRPAVPPERLERAAMAVRAHWETEWRRRARRRRLWVAAGLAVAATIVGAAFGLALRREPGASSGVVAEVQVVVDSVWSRGTSEHAEARALRPGQDVPSGAEIATAEEGRAALLLASGHSVRLDGGTRLKVLSDHVLQLDRGAVYVDGRGARGAAVVSVEVRTPQGTVRDVGTQFEVRELARALRLRVREGQISLDRQGSSLQLEAGQELELGRDGAITRRDLSPFGPEWDWVVDTAPRLDIAGRSLQEFLEWIARERGQSLSFESAEAAAAAPQIVLSGSIEGMTLEQALESVLPACRMSHRSAGSVLHIRALAPGEERP